MEEILANPPERFASLYRNEKRLPALELIQKTEQTRLFILGKPGAGKTTLLRHLVLQGVQGEIDKIPIFISLHDWSRSDNLDLLTYIEHQFEICQFPEALPLIKYFLQDGRAMVLFDGLDEVRREGGLRATITRQLADFCRQYYATPCLITCRIAATDQTFQLFQDVEVADFNNDQIRTFVNNWFADTPSPNYYDNSPKRKAFFEQFYASENKGVRDLGRNPLLLTMLCLAFDEAMTFPPRRAELYEDALDALLRKWDASRSIQRDEIYRGLSRQDKHHLFAQVAHRTFYEELYFIPRFLLVTEIRTALSQLPLFDKNDEIDGETLLQAIIAQHGLFVERARKIYSFAHLTFHEYYTAKYIADHQNQGSLPRLMPYLTDPRWREIFLLTASLLPDATQFLEVMQAAIFKLIQGDAGLMALLQWVNQKSEGGGVEEKVIYLTLTLEHTLEHALEHTLEHTLDLFLAPAFDSTRDLAQDFNLNFTIVLTTISALTVGPNLFLDRVSNFTFDPNLTNRLINHQDILPKLAILDLTLMYAFQMAMLFSKKGALKHPGEMEISIYHKLWQNLISLTIQIPNSQITLEELTPPTTLNSIARHTFAQQLHTFIQTTRNLGHKFNLSDKQLKLLHIYLGAYHLLVQCLNIATLSSAKRAAIRAQILSVPEA